MSDPKRARTWALTVGFHALMWFGLWLMISASASYWELGDAHPFILEKLPLAQPALFRAALYVHVPSALLALPLCLLLLSQTLRRRYPRVHRWLGRITGLLVLLLVVPTGAYLALFAQGGWLTTFGFWLTGGITFVAMCRSIMSARAGQLVAHRRFSAHVVAQLSVAVVSRLLLIAAELGELYGEWTYLASLWVPVLACAWLAELVTSSPRRPHSKGSRHDEMVSSTQLNPLR